jgi:cationic peptide transport system ATP-binding protein
MVETLLEVRNLSKTFRYRTGLFHRQNVEAVKPLSFTLREKQTLAIIGENGSGKSTLAKMSGCFSLTRQKKITISYSAECSWRS